jgi:hypothetical protein
MRNDPPPSKTQSAPKKTIKFDNDSRSTTDSIGCTQEGLGSIIPAPQIFLEENKMTYQELLKSIQSMPAERLKDDVSVYDGEMGEMFELKEVRIVEHEDEVIDELDEGHYYLALRTSNDV